MSLPIAKHIPGYTLIDGQALRENIRNSTTHNPGDVRSEVTEDLASSGKECKAGHPAHHHFVPNPTVGVVIALPDTCAEPVPPFLRSGPVKLKEPKLEKTGLKLDKAEPQVEKAEPKLAKAPTKPARAPLGLDI